MQMATNPELMREMMRNTDRAMSNIENHPEGFNLLRRMYTNVQEPMMNAATPPAGSGGRFSPPTAATPVAPNAPNPNNSPLPNPWAPPSRKFFFIVVRHVFTLSFSFHRNCRNRNRSRSRNGSRSWRWGNAKLVWRCQFC